MNLTTLRICLFTAPLLLIAPFLVMVANIWCWIVFGTGFAPEGFYGMDRAFGSIMSGAVGLLSWWFAVDVYRDARNKIVTRVTDRFKE